MYKLLLDSDALIKISKAEFLDAAAENFDLSITEEVFEETVVQGKKGFYPDADKIERLIQDGEIKILKGSYRKKRESPKQSFGKGELSIFQAYSKGSLIVTDDFSFTSYLNKVHIKSVSSAHLLYVLVKKNKLKKDKVFDCLEKLKPFIRKEIYKLIKTDIEGE